MHALIVLGLVAVAGGIAFLRGGNSAGFFKGQTRTVTFTDGSKPEHLSRLRILFDNVVDRGGGVYMVTSGFDGNVTLPSGAQVSGVGATPIILYSVFHRGRHIGFAFGPGPAAAVKKVFPSLTIQRSSQSYPASWASKWKAIWGDDNKKTVWGRFYSPYNEAIMTYLRWAGYYAIADRSAYSNTADYLSMKDEF